MKASKLTTEIKNTMFWKSKIDIFSILIVIVPDDGVILL
jgi:hypothetical protein